MKNRTVIGIICMILAVAVVFGIVPIINKNWAAKVDIVCVVKDVPQGGIITKDDVKIVTVGAYNLSDKAIKSEDSVIGKYAVTDLKEDEILLNTKITDKRNGADDVFRTLDGTRQAMSVSISNFAGGLSGKLQNGDIISVISSNAGSITIHPELKYVRVITATSTGGIDTGEMGEGKTEQPSTVTLLVTEAQAVLLAQSETNGKIHIALVYRGTDEFADKLLAEQDEMLEQIAAEAEEAESGGDIHDEVTENESND